MKKNEAVPRSKQQNEVVRAQSRERILASALTLFAERGYAGTSVRDIARAAGIAQGLLYNYFASKEDLLYALFTQAMADVHDSFGDAEQGGTPAERLERLIRRSFEVVAAHRDFWKLSYSVRMQTVVLVDLGERLDAWIATILATLEHHLRATGVANPEIESAVLFALIDGIAQHYVMRPDSYPLQPIVECVVQRYSRLATGPSAAYECPLNIAEKG